MEEPGISLSFSRPRASKDIAFAESIFRTLKYHHSYLRRRFRDILSVREWVDQFTAWYNEEHRHSGIKYVTPNQRYFDLEVHIVQRSQNTPSAGVDIQKAVNNQRL
jgi:putative transposase